MPPKRPPPLPRSLFTDGPLAHGSGPIPPTPSSVHPSYIIDAHHRGSFLIIPDDAPYKRPVTGAVTIAVPDQAVTLLGMVEIKDGVPIGGKQKLAQATVVHDNAGPVNVQSSEPAVDLVVPNTAPLNDKQWDNLEQVVNSVDGGFKRVEGEIAEHGDSKRKILISGVLPPPLTKASSTLLQSDEYGLYQSHLAQMSLHADVVLKALPPVVDTRVAGDSKWWEDASEVERVAKMYLAPAIETFGTHRIVFGSTEAYRQDDPHVSVPIKGPEWYALLRKCISELGEDEESMTKVMGANAVDLYALK